MGILDDFKKLQDEGMNISSDVDVMEEIKKQHGIDYDCEKNASMDEYPDGELVGEEMSPEDLIVQTFKDEYPDGELASEEMSPEDLIVQTFKNEYKKYHEEDLTIIKSKDYEPVVIKAYCPECGKEIISTAPVMFNPYTLDKICRYDCECGWKGNLDYAYPRLVMVNKNTGEELEVYGK